MKKPLTIFLSSLIVFSLFAQENRDKMKKKETHPMAVHVKGFHIFSYYAGSAATMAEFVSLGCKDLALSSPYTEEELAIMLEPTREAVREYGLPIYVERDFLVTPLYDAALTQGKTVILIARNQAVIDAYLALKAEMKQAMREGRGEQAAVDVARRFGKLLSYNDETIDRLLAENQK